MTISTLKETADMMSLNHIRTLYEKSLDIYFDFLEKEQVESDKVDKNKIRANRIYYGRRNRLFDELLNPPLQ